MTTAITMTDFLLGPQTGRAAVLADLDGCILAENTVLPQIPDLFARAGERLWIVSNNSTDTAIDLSARLAGLGLTLPPERIFLAGEQTLRRLAEANPPPRVALFAGPRLQALASMLGLVIDHDTPDLVVLARDTAFDFARFATLVALVHRGVPLQLTNPDCAHPGPDGTPRPETGALYAAVRAIVPGVAALSIGKPEPDLALMALARAGVPPEDAVFLGDTPETDGRAAAAAGIDFVHIAPPRAGDHARQAQVWDAVKNSWNKEPYAIRRMLTETSVRAPVRRAVFVGVGAHEAARVDSDEPNAPGDVSQSSGLRGPVARGMVPRLQDRSQTDVPQRRSRLRRRPRQRNRRRRGRDRLGV